MPLVFDIEDITTDPLVTVDQFQQLTGNYRTYEYSVEAILLQAQRLVEEYLRRPLQLAERTETLRSFSGRVYPSATPISSITGEGTIRGNAIIPTSLAFGYGDLPGPFSTSVDSYCYDDVTVTYIGGFTSDTLPVTLQRAIIDTASALLRLSRTVNSDAVAGAIPWIPTVADIGAELRSRTVDDTGTELGTFTANTRPTNTDVLPLIDRVVQRIKAKSGAIPTYLHDYARRVAALGVAMEIERSYWPEQIDSGRSPYDQMKVEFDEGMAELTQSSLDAYGDGSDPSELPLRSALYPIMANVANWRKRWAP